MNTEELSTRERIMHATVSFIEKHGIHAVTTRGIAKEANVNSAAINYYFGTKEKLLDETLKMTLQNLKVDFDQISAREGQKSGDILQTLLYYFLAGSMRFPEITKAHLYGQFVNNEQDSLFSEYFKSFFSAIADKVISSSEADNTGSAPADETRLSMAQLFSAVLFPCIFPDLFKNSLGLDLKDDETQRRYISSLVRRFYPTDGKLGSWHPTPL